MILSLKTNKASLDTLIKVSRIAEKTDEDFHVQSGLEIIEHTYEMSYFISDKRSIFFCLGVLVIAKDNGNIEIPIEQILSLYKE